jgi:hypothetical protein
VSRAQLRAQPRQVLPKGKITPATVADHIERHKGDSMRFVIGRLQSLCAQCHKREAYRRTLHHTALALWRGRMADAWPN